MLDKFVFWFTENRKKIGYSLGALNILSGVMCLTGYGQPATGYIQLFVGAVFIFDAWMMP